MFLTVSECFEGGVRQELSGYEAQVLSAYEAQILSGYEAQVGQVPGGLSWDWSDGLPRFFLRGCSPGSTREDGDWLCAAVPRRARIQGSQTSVSLNFRLESNKEEEDWSTRIIRPRK